MTKGPYLDGQLLIAMPGMSDPRFDRSVIYMCAHSEQGAMGIIINKTTPLMPKEDIRMVLRPIVSDRWPAIGAAMNPANWSSAMPAPTQNTS